MRSRAGLALATGLLVLVLVSCGDEDEPSAAGGASSSAPGAAGGQDHAVDDQGGHGEHDHGGSSGAPAFDRSQANTQVVTILKDFAFVGIPPTLPGPKVFFEARNEGPADHELVIFDQSGKGVGGIGPFPRGETKTLVVELAPGRYTIRCLVKAGDRTHAQDGMETSISVS